VRQVMRDRFHLVNMSTLQNKGYRRGEAPNFYNLFVGQIYLALFRDLCVTRLLQFCEAQKNNCERPDGR
jgi:hypothetical protein